MIHTLVLLLTRQPSKESFQCFTIKDNADFWLGGRSICIYKHKIASIGAEDVAQTDSLCLAYEKFWV